MSQAEAGFVPHPKACNCGDCTIQKLEEANLFKSNRIADLVKDYTELQHKYDELERWDAIWRERVDKAERKYEALVDGIEIMLSVGACVNPVMENNIRALLEQEVSDE